MADPTAPLLDLYEVKLNAAELGALTALAAAWQGQMMKYEPADFMAARLFKKLVDAFPGRDALPGEEPHPP